MFLNIFFALRVRNIAFINKNYLLIIICTNIQVLISSLAVYDVDFILLFMLNNICLLIFALLSFLLVLNYFLFRFFSSLTFLRCLLELVLEIFLDINLTTDLK